MIEKYDSEPRSIGRCIKKWILMFQNETIRRKVEQIELSGEKNRISHKGWSEDTRRRLVHRIEVLVSSANQVPKCVCDL